MVVRFVPFLLVDQRFTFSSVCGLGFVDMLLFSFSIITSFSHYSSITIKLMFATFIVVYLYNSVIVNSQHANSKKKLRGTTSWTDY